MGIKEIEEYTKKMVKPSRFEHCVRVAKMCVELCKMFGISEEKGYLVGISHDMCKDFPDEKMLVIARQSDVKLSEYDITHPAVLHGICASVLLNNQFGIFDEDVLNAVSSHVTGTKKMCDLAKILYISDKSEPGRKHSSEEYRQSLFKLSLNDMFKSVLMNSYDYINSKGYEIYPFTKEIIDFYLGENK